MKKPLSIILIILGSAISIFCFLVMVRMLLNFSHMIVSLRLGDPSQLLAFLFFVFGVGGGIALIFLWRKLLRETQK